MSDQNLVQFLQKVKENLMRNGFPQKRVSLPLEKLYESAEKIGINFNDCLDQLALEEITHVKDGDRIIFSKSLPDQKLPPEDLFAKAQEIFQKMSPEERIQLQAMMENLTDEQREEMLLQGKKMGLI